MNTDKHTVTIPIEDYNELIKESSELLKELDKAKKAFEELQKRVNQRMSSMVNNRLQVVGLDLRVEHQEVSMLNDNRGNVLIEFKTTSPC